jgi:glycine/D-amino acid oxidase-like deaminating enzyme
MTRTRYGDTPWVSDVPKRRRPDFPRYRGTETYPAVIVGGGLSGCLTAYAFAAAGIKVALFEADRLGLAGASRGPGVLRGEATASYRDIESRYGRRAARAVFDSSRRAVLDLATTSRRLGVKGGVEVEPALRVLASYDADEKALLKDVTMRRDAGLDAVYLKAAVAARESKVDSARAAVKLRDWGQANPYALVSAFGDAAVERGAAIFERSIVKRIRVRRRDVEIQVEGGVATAATVIVCTGEPTDLFRSLKRHVRLDERYAVVTDRLPASLRKRINVRVPLVTDTETPPHLVRWMEDGRVVMAGADQPRPPTRLRDKVLVQRTGQLMYELSRLYPDLSGVYPTHGWAVPIAATVDGVMYAGPHRNYPRHLFAWGTQHDPAQAFLASRILLRNYLGESDRDDSYFAFTRA